MKNLEHPLVWFIFIIKSSQVIQLASVGCLGLAMHALTRMQEMMMYRKQPQAACVPAIQVENHRCFLEAL